ncbi:hydroxylysine kinase [Episyrphus balteatus]|uniref:hydroxylysine kinase n=1 Tax=Episyrphus balteatus TaxID=286459 RepID=UPI002485CC3D|nr:hydroxylysine kinase [Episyrphus balteatus]
MEMELNALSKKSYTLNTNFELGEKSSGEGKFATVSEDGKKNGTEELLQPGSDIQPKVTIEDVNNLAQRLYGITVGELKEMISYDDRNYFITEDKNVKNPLITRTWPHGYTLKILNAHDSKEPEFIDAQNELLMHLSKQGIQCPRPVANLHGKYFSVEKINGVNYVVRLLEFIPGKIFNQVTKSNYLFFQSGEYLAKVNRALKDFNHDAYQTHKTLWNLMSIPKLRDFVYVLTDHGRKSIVEQIIESFETNVLPHVDKMKKQVIHGDYNEQNIIVEPKKNSDEFRVCGIIDFGDTTYSPIIFEIGIAMTYMILQAKSLVAGGVFLAGYDTNKPLKPEEKKFLKYCVAARLAQSLTMGAYTHSLHPSNDYVLVTQEDGWKLIEDLWVHNFEGIDEIWADAADNYLKQSDK